MAVEISPQVLTLIQQHGIGELTKQFSNVQSIATRLFAIIATLEIALFGLIWSYRQDSHFGLLVFKVIKLGIIFFIITSYPYLMNNLIAGFTQIYSGNETPEWHKVVFNPTYIWKYGFDSSISLLKMATYYGTANIGMSMIYLFLGFAVLIALTLIGAQIILVVLGFYLISLLVLLLLPIGTLSICKGLLSKLLQSLLQIGARVFGMIFVLTLALAVWGQFDFNAWTKDTNLMQPLGLFTSVIVISYLIVKLPAWCAQTIGSVSGNLFDDFQNSSGQGSIPSVNTSSYHTVSAVAAGASISPAIPANNFNTQIPVGSQSNAANSMQAATQIVPGTNPVMNASSPLSMNSGSAVNVNRLAEAADKMAKSASVLQKQNGISNAALNRLKLKTNANDS